MPTPRLPPAFLFRLGLILAAAAPLPAQAETPPPTRETEQPQSADDAEVEATLRSVFREVSALQDVRATVRHRVVKLSGTVPDSAMRDRAESIAQGFSHVLLVDNALELPAPSKDVADAEADPQSATDNRLAERMRKAFARFDSFDEVEIEVVAGVVKLRGQVLDSRDVETAEELARSVDGVVFVDNQIEETTSLTKRIVPSLERMLGWVRDFLISLPLLLVALLVGALFWWLGRTLSESQRLFARMADKKLVQNILRQIVRTLFLFLGIFLGLEIMGATALVGAVLGTAGVVGLALGFAFRDIVENYLASIILSVRQPFRSKDLVEIDGHLGTVIHMTTRDTVLMTVEGNHLTLPNAQVFKSTVVNFTRNPKRRFSVPVGVGTDVDLKEATALGLGVLEKMKGVVDDPPPYARVESLGDSNVTVRFYGWVDQRTADFTKVESVAVRLIKAVMDENQVDMPVPTYQVLLRRPESEAAVPESSHRTSEAHADAASADVAPDQTIEKQVDEELQRTEEEDLLTQQDET